jgi:hypothetical protein
MQNRVLEIGHVKKPLDRPFNYRNRDRKGKNYSNKVKLFVMIKLQTLQSKCVKFVNILNGAPYDKR